MSCFIITNALKLTRRQRFGFRAVKPQFWQPRSQTVNLKAKGPMKITPLLALFPIFRIHNRLFVSLLLAAAWLLPASTSRANNLTVTTTADNGMGSLRTAISSVDPNTGGTITFAPGVTGTVTLTSGELDIGRNLNLIGPGAETLAVSGNNASRVFNISAGATVAISGLTVSGGLSQGATGSDTGSPGQGGGILNSGTLILTGCALSGNRAIGGAAPTAGLGEGGAICALGLLTLSNCTVSANTAAGGVGTYDDNGPGGYDGNGFGGGLFFGTGSGGSQVVNCTIVGNSALVNEYSGTLFGGGGSGGGICTATAGGSPVLLLSCTVSGNNCTATQGGEADGSAEGGGIVSIGGGSVILKNTIVSGNSVVGAGNPGDVAAGPDVYGRVTSGGFNLIGTADESSGWLVGTNGADQLGTADELVDPQLGPLRDNGGPTPTMALPADSAAVDQGYSFGLTTDQRGSPRPFDYLEQPYPPGGDGSDIGAFELHQPVLILAGLTNSVLSLFNVAWNESDYYAQMNASGGGTMRTSFHPFGLSPTANTAPPMFGVEVSPGLTSGHWMGFAPPVRLINGNVYVARDTMVPTGGFYRLSTAVTNLFILPGATTPATLITSNSATLNGTTTPYGFNTAHWFEYGADTNYGTSTVTNSTLATSTNLASLSCALGGLAPSTVYHFQLVVTDDDGIQLGGDQSFTTLSAVPPTPTPVVVSYAATSVGATNVTLNGSVNGNGLPVGAWFEYGTNTSYGSSTYNNQFFTSSDYGTTQSYSNTITGLSPATIYHYRAIASSMAGQGFGADTTFTTAAPPPPPTVATLPASSVVRSSATLNGTVNPNESSGTVYFQYGTSTSYGSTTTPTPVNSPESFSAPITGLSPGITYHFQIVATNAGGTSYGADTTFKTIGD